MSDNVSTGLARFKAPDTTLIIFSIIVLAALLTWIVPPGSYQRTEIQVEGVGAREVVVPGSYARVEREDATVVSRLVHSVTMVFKAPILGFVDEEAAPIIAFILFVGGAFAVLTATGAVDAGLKALVDASQGSHTIDQLLIPLFMTLFSLGGAIFGMAEETIPFVLIFVPLSIALGYDSLVGVSIPFLGSAAGFAAAFFNPFTVGVAQGIAGVPPFSGLEFRIAFWFVTTALTIAFVMAHAAKVRRDPTSSPTYAIDELHRNVGVHAAAGVTEFTRTHKWVLSVFFLGLAALVFGVLRFQWYIVEIAALFLAIGAALGAIGGLGANGTARAFADGIRDLAGTAVLVGLARGILIVLQDGQTVDTILNTMASALEGTSTTVAAMSMFTVQTAINFFVPSGSGQAALTMPLMAPLADLVGVSRQTAVLAFQMGDGFTNMIIPTSAVVMGVLSLARIPWPTWARWLWPFQVAMFVLGLITVAVAVAVGFS